MVAAVNDTKQKVNVVVIQKDSGATEVVAVQNLCAEGQQIDLIDFSACGSYIVASSWGGTVLRVNGIGKVNIVQEVCRG